MFRDPAKDRENDIETLKKEVQAHLNTLVRTMTACGNIGYLEQKPAEALRRLTKDMGWEVYQLKFESRSALSGGLAMGSRILITAQFGNTRGGFPVENGFVRDFVLTLKSTIES